jgi:hypothetical protein
MSINDRLLAGAFALCLLSTSALRVKADTIFRLSSTGAILHEVARPDMVEPFSPETDSGHVAWPDPGAFRLPAQDLATLLAPDPLHPLVVDHPSRHAA